LYDVDGSGDHENLLEHRQGWPLFSPKKRFANILQKQNSKNNL